MPNIINKVVFDGRVLIDLTDTTTTASDAASGTYFYTANGVFTQGSLANGNNLGYGYTDGSLPLVGVALVGYAHVLGDTSNMMKFGEGLIGTGRVV